MCLCVWTGVWGVELESPYRFNAHVADPARGYLVRLAGMLELHWLGRLQLELQPSLSALHLVVTPPVDPLARRIDLPQQPQPPWSYLAPRSDRLIEITVEGCRAVLGQHQIAQIVCVLSCGQIQALANFDAVFAPLHYDWPAAVCLSLRHPIRWPGRRSLAITEASSSKCRCAHWVTVTKSFWNRAT